MTTPKTRKPKNTNDKQKTESWPMTARKTIDIERLRADGDMRAKFWLWVDGECLKAARKLWAKDGPFTTEALLNAIIPWDSKDAAVRTSMLSVIGKRWRVVGEPEGWVTRNFGPGAVVCVKRTW